MSKKRNGRSRVTIELPDEIYRALKKGCKNSYTTYTNYIITALFYRFEREEIKIKLSKRDKLYKYSEDGDKE